jgi:hypothetical protein
LGDPIARFWVQDLPTSSIIVIAERQSSTARSDVLETGRDRSTARIGVQSVTDPLILVQAGQPCGFHGFDVNESIGPAGIIGNEAEATIVIEEFDGADGHIRPLFAENVRAPSAQRSQKRERKAGLFTRADKFRRRRR